jgi:hypothetical protein
VLSSLLHRITITIADTETDTAETKEDFRWERVDNFSIELWLGLLSMNT